MKRTLLLLLTLLIAADCLFAQQQKAPPLNTVAEFAVLSAGSIVNADTTVVYANLGITDGDMIGFDPIVGPGVILGNADIRTTVAQTARQDALAAYEFLRKQPAEYTRNPKLGNGFLPIGDPEVTNGMVLSPGIYKFNDPNVLLSGTLRLDGLNRTDAVFIFQIDGNLSIDPGSVISVEKGTQAKNVFFQIGGRLVPVAGGGVAGGNAVLKGNFLVNNSGSTTGNAIVLGEGTSVEGRILALNGGISLLDNNIFLPNIVEADLGISKTASRSTLVLGGIVTYTITVVNNGPDKAINARVLEDFPAQYMAFLDFTATPAANVTFDPTSNIFYLGDMDVRDKIVLKIRAQALMPGTKISNKVKVVSDSPDPKPDNDESEVVIKVPVVAADVRVIKNVNKAKANVGETIQYTVTVENLGPDKATNINVTDIFPSDYLALIGQPTTTLGIYTQNDLFIPELIVGAKAVLTINARIIKEGRIVNVAQITSAGQSDLNTTNNRDEAITDAGVVPLSDLEITKTAGSASVVLGNNATYTLTARNLGPHDATGVRVTEILPKDLTFVSATPAGQYNSTSGLWTIGSLSVGGSATLTIVAAPQTVGQVANTASIQSDQVDLIAGNDSATATICVVPYVPVLATGKRDVCVGDMVTYSVNDINGVMAFQYSLPPGFVKISGSGSTVVVQVTDAAQENSEVSVVPINATTLCANGEALVVRVKVNRPPAAPGAITGPATSCAGLEQTFSLANVPGADTYTWTVPANWQIRSGQNTTSITVLVGTDQGKVAVTVSNDCGIGGNASTSTVIPDPVPTVPVITDQSGPCAGLVYSITAIPGATSYTWTVPEGFTITAGQGTTSIKVIADRLDRQGTVTVTANNPQCSSTVATLAANAGATDANLKFPTAFTPNGDDKNETWIVDNLLKFPDNDLQIVNRWGNEVYQTRSYQNNWRAAGLAEGTYFYVLRVKLCDGINKVYRGYITVVR